MSDKKLADGMIVNRKHLERAIMELETTVEMIHAGHIPGRSIVSALRDNCRELRHVKNGISSERPSESHPAGSRLPTATFAAGYRAEELVADGGTLAVGRKAITDDQLAELRRRGVNVIFTDGPESGGA